MANDELFVNINQHIDAENERMVHLRGKLLQDFIY
jgi:hypothetical protein